MFNVQSTKNEIKKLEIEAKILKAKIDFFEKLSDEIGLTDQLADYVLSGLVQEPSICTETELETIRFFRNKIANLETQLYAIA
jgi:hypothetical protein